jgi:hypothetical protein
VVGAAGSGEERGRGEDPRGEIAGPFCSRSAGGSRTAAASARIHLSPSVRSAEKVKAAPVHPSDGCPADPQCLRNLAFAGPVGVVKVVKLPELCREAGNPSPQQMLELEIALTTTREGCELLVVAAGARAATQQVNSLVHGHSEDPGSAQPNFNPCLPHVVSST